MCYLDLRNVKGYRWNHKRNYRLFNVIDDHNREGLAIEIDYSLSAQRVTRALDQIIEWRGKPNRIRGIHIQLAKQITGFVSNFCLTSEKQAQNAHT